MRIEVASAVAVSLCCYSLGAIAQTTESRLPRGLVFLRDVVPSIIQDIRYAGHDNFTGRPLAGYDAAECILTERTANALSNAQKAVSPRYSLKVFDCYRPRMAVSDLLSWSQQARQDPRRKEAYHPQLDKKDLFDRGFISRRSQHSRGVAVDLVMVEVASSDQNSSLLKPFAPCSKVAADRSVDTNIDFGTGFDCFDERSAMRNGSIPAEAQKNRQHLLSIMNKAGFSNYSKEWWHFEFDDPSQPPEYNVRVTSRAREKALSPEFAKLSVNSCGTSQPLRIVCSPDTIRLPLYEGPSRTTKQIQELLTDGLVSCIRCTGRVPLTEFVSLDATSKSIGDPPWCEVRTPDRTSGWLDGRFLAPVSEAAPECPELGPRIDLRE